MNDLIQQFNHITDHFFSQVSTCKINYGEFISFTTGVQASGLNPVFVRNISSRFLDILKSCEIYYMQKGLPWALLLPESLSSPELKNSLKHHGFSLVDKGIVMSCDLTGLTLKTPSPPLHMTNMEKRLEEWGLPILEGFASTEDNMKLYIKRHLTATQRSKGIWHFSAFINGQIVSSLTLTATDEHARLDDVATIPYYQKRGYASGLITLALQHAHDMGVKTCFLEASLAGYGLYKRLGFKEIFNNYYYEK
ncbi:MULTISPECIES: GNAT family N-acetyltransferase [Legionella]|uniref:GNAT family N-acetyltransferase n=1 Tax=Legionella TaxID=445 RepID=UPI000F8F207C|nr:MULTISPECIES: GNAT family N-acetyltransferase [Legionella]MCP0913403.1 GNAT family N-acetyltransferase [Legionella sp. 27cVA30]RUR09857.1 GNAT family N-acetyltransferase [Legionella septentrionalis]